MNMDTALLVVDVQVGQVERPVFQATEVLARIERLINRARASAVPVIYVQHDGKEGELFAVGSHSWQIYPSIAPSDGELIIHKRASDAFYETPLQRELDARRIRKLVVVGCRTEYCIDTTCRRATTLGYDVTLVSDAHTTTDNDVLRAAQIIAHHNMTLDDFGNDNHAIAANTTNEITF
jgi:nicotinamidase-related amidase